MLKGLDIDEAKLAENPRALALHAIPIEKKDGEADPHRVGVYMPIGAKILNVGPTSDGEGLIAVVTCHPRAMQMRVWHPMVIIRLGETGAPLLGKSFGPSLGLIPVLGEGAAIFPEHPWPTSMLEATDTRGEA